MSNFSLGELAIKLGFIDNDSYKKILQFQIANNSTFISSVKALKMLASEQVDNIISRQFSNNMLFGEALIKKNILTHEELEEYLKDFRKEQSVIEFKIINTIFRFRDTLCLFIMFSLPIFNIKQFRKITVNPFD